MEYKIKEVSKKTGLSIDTLRYYDKLGIVSPKRHKNDYRYYDDTDIVKLEYAVVMKYAMFSLDDIKSMIEWFATQPPYDECNGFFHNMLENNIDSLEKRIVYYQLIVKMMKQILPMIESADTYQTNQSEIANFIKSLFDSITSEEWEAE